MVKIAVTVVAVASATSAYFAFTSYTLASFAVDLKLATFSPYLKVSKYLSTFSPFSQSYHQASRSSQVYAGLTPSHTL